MTKHRQILNFIEIIRDSFPQATEVYTSGSCFQFYRILKRVYSEAEAYYNISHVITKIGRYYYDINGVVHDYKDYTPYDTWGKRIMKNQTKHRYGVHINGFDVFGNKINSGF